MALFINRTYNLLLPLIKPQKDACQYRSTDAMPSARNGAGQHSQWLGCKESTCQYGSQSCVLHAYLDRNRAFLCRIELGQ